MTGDNCQWSSKSAPLEVVSVSPPHPLPPIIIDELDSIAGRRDGSNSPYLRQVVSQLLVLMDGLTERGRVLIIATTNHPQHIDPAILRPGRIDRQIYMGPPDKLGKMALIDKLLSHMPIANDLKTKYLADLIPAISGAEIEHVVNEAGLLAVKEAIANNISTDAAQVSVGHFLHTINNLHYQMDSP